MQAFLILAILLAILINFSDAIPVEEELTMTLKERNALEKFRIQVGPKLKEDYMKKDLYLLRWLRATKLDLQKAEQRFDDNLKFREEFRMDDIVNEDWSDFENEYPYTIDTHDKEGRPIVSFSLGDWDFRKAIIQGKRDRAVRYINKNFEEATILIREKQARGENVTQAVILIDLGQFNLQQNACFQCLPAIYQYFEHQIFYPNLIDKLILINTPGIFDTLLQLLGPIMATETRQALRIFGTDKNKWKSYLYTIIDKDQLYTEFGGTRTKD